MDILYARDEATVSEVLEDVPDAPSRTSIRTIMRILEEKGHLKHKQQGREYVYYPSKPASQVAPPALQRVLRTFFGGSLEKAVAMHLADQNTEISKAELRRLANIVNEARRKESSNE